MIFRKKKPRNNGFPRNYMTKTIIPVLQEPCHLKLMMLRQSFIDFLWNSYLTNYVCHFLSLILLFNFVVFVCLFVSLEGVFFACFFFRKRSVSTCIVNSIHVLFVTMIAQLCIGWKILCLIPPVIAYL